MGTTQTGVFISLFVITLCWAIYFVSKRRLADATFVIGIGFVVFYLMLDSLKTNNEIQVMMNLAEPSWSNLPDWVFVAPLVVAFAFVVLSIPMLLVDRKKRHYQKAMSKMT